MLVTIQRAAHQYLSITPSDTNPDVTRNRVPFVIIVETGDHKSAQALTTPRQTAVNGFNTRRSTLFLDQTEIYAEVQDKFQKACSRGPSERQKQKRPALVDILISERPIWDVRRWFQKLCTISQPRERHKYTMEVQITLKIQRSFLDVKGITLVNSYHILRKNTEGTI